MQFEKRRTAMAITATARKNHEELFPHHVSILAETDPEFVEVFDNFAFDEALGYCELDTRTRLMAVLAALIAQHAVSEYRAMLTGALNVGVTPVEVKEIVYQSVAYVGIGRVFDFLHATNDVLAARGVRLPLEPQATTTAENRLERGLELSKSVFGAQIDRMYQAHDLRLRLR
jgi:4-carboxymuconolactone decarboxylase